jgi:hypothetical protein
MDARPRQAPVRRLGSTHRHRPSTTSTSALNRIKFIGARTGHGASKSCGADSCAPHPHGQHMQKSCKPRHGRAASPSQSHAAIVEGAQRRGVIVAPAWQGRVIGYWRPSAEQNVLAPIVSLNLDVAGSFWTTLDFLIALRSRSRTANVSDISGFLLVLPDRIELPTSPLPRECSTAELRRRCWGGSSLIP